MYNPMIRVRIDQVWRRGMSSLMARCGGGRGVESNHVPSRWTSYVSSRAVKEGPDLICRSNEARRKGSWLLCRYSSPSISQRTRALPAWRLADRRWYGFSSSRQCRGSGGLTCLHPVEECISHRVQMSVLKILTSHVVSSFRGLRPAQIYDSISDGRERAGACEDEVRYHWIAEGGNRTYGGAAFLALVANALLSLLESSRVSS